MDIESLNKIEMEQIEESAKKSEENVQRAKDVLGKRLSDVDSGVEVILDEPLDKVDLPERIGVFGVHCRESVFLGSMSHSEALEALDSSHFTPLFGIDGDDFNLSYSYKSPPEAVVYEAYSVRDFWVCPD